MNLYRHIAVALLSCSLTAACASAPISFTSAGDGAQAASPAQSGLTRAATQLEETYRARGWIREASAATGALGWMNRLAGSADAGRPADPVEVYLEVNHIALDAPGLPARLATDITAARVLAQEVDRQAGDLAEHGHGLSRGALARSLGEVETAMTHTRDALELFDTLIARTATDETETAALRTARDRFFVQSEALRDRADELAELRRDLRARPIS